MILAPPCSQCRHITLEMQKPTGPLRCAVKKAAAELVASLLKQSSPTASPQPSRPVLLGDAEWGAHTTQHGCSGEQQKPLFLDTRASL